MDDATAVSPYPRDPWGLVAAEPEPETTSAQLLRAAVDSAYAPSDTSPGTGVHPAEDADAADWMNAGSTAGAFAVPPFGGPSSPSSPSPSHPSSPSSFPRNDDGFLAPLRPLPRQEHDDAEGSATGDFTRPDVRFPVDDDRASFTDPGLGRGSFTDPGFTRPSSTDPGPERSSFTDPGLERPSFTDPALERPSFTDPGSARPSFTDPGSGRGSSTDSGPERSSFTDPGLRTPRTGPEEPSRPVPERSRQAEERPERSPSGEPTATGPSGSAGPSGSPTDEPSDAGSGPLGSAGTAGSFGASGSSKAAEPPLEPFKPAGAPLEPFKPARSGRSLDPAEPPLEPFRPSGPASGPSGPASGPAPEPFKPAGTTAGPAEPPLEPLKPSAPKLEGFSFGNFESRGADRDRSPSEAVEPDTAAEPTATDAVRRAPETPGSGASGAGSPGSEKPGSKMSGTEKPGSEMSGTEKSGPEGPGSEKPGPKPGSEASKPGAAGPFGAPVAFGADRPQPGTPERQAPGSFGSAAFDLSGPSGPAPFTRGWDAPSAARDDAALARSRDDQNDRDDRNDRGAAPRPDEVSGRTGDDSERDRASGRGAAFGPGSGRDAAVEREPGSGRDTAFRRDRDVAPREEAPFSPEHHERPFTPAASATPADAPDRERPSAPERDRPADRGDRLAASRKDRDPIVGRGTTDRGNSFFPDEDEDEELREPYQPRRRHSAPPPAFSAPSRQSSGTARPSADSLDPDSLLRGRRNGPSSGWRKLIYRATAGLIKPGESPEVRRRGELVTRARTPVATGHHRVAVLSLKGGVGKTTTTVGLGATLAQIRGDRVIAVDANPDRGTLSDKLELETSATVRDLLNERQQIKRYVDIRAFTSQAPSRLEVLASDRDPSVSEAFSASDYQAVAQVLENFYSICITDCGTGLLHSAMSGVLGLADQLVLVSSPSVDGARAASATLDWLEAHHYEDLVSSATVVLCSVRPRSKSTVDLDRLEAHFAARCRAVIRVPYDPHLEEGAEIDLERLQPATRDAYLRLAASVGDGFAAPQP
ncbi:AAA family ATPase [Streptosporangium sandarakinum]|uniref:nucleotide-binding protein n=1 Tax=Streptosporangium sandarakinum TaxID=1260955 RepID=UPI0033A6533A